MIRKTCLVGLASLSLSACGGSSATFSSDFSGLVSEAERLTARLEPLSGTPTLPSGGEPVYDGVIVLADDFDTSAEGVIGSVNLTANFSSDTINGTGSGFYSTAVNSVGDPIGTGTPVAGTLNLSATGIDTIFVLDVDGDVTVGGALRPVSGSMLGAFFGPSAEMVSAAGENLSAGIGYDVDVVLVAD